MLIQNAANSGRMHFEQSRGFSTTLLFTLDHLKDRLLLRLSQLRTTTSHTSLTTCLL